MLKDEAMKSLMKWAVVLMVCAWCSAQAAEVV